MPKGKENMSLPFYDAFMNGRKKKVFASRRIPRYQTWTAPMGRLSLKDTVSFFQKGLSIMSTIKNESPMSVIPGATERRPLVLNIDSQHQMTRFYLGLFAIRHVMHFRSAKEADD